MVFIRNETYRDWIFYYNWRIKKLEFDWRQGRIVINKFNGEIRANEQLPYKILRNFLKNKQID